MKKSGFICLIVFAIVVILCALFCSIKFKKKDVDVTLLYQDFISDRKYFSDCQEMDTEMGGCRMNINVKCAIVAAVAGLLSAIIVNIILRV